MPQLVDGFLNSGVQYLGPDVEKTKNPSKCCTRPGSSFVGGKRFRNCPEEECDCHCPGGEDRRQTLVLLRSVTEMHCLSLHNNPDESEERCGSPLPWQTSLEAALQQISHSLLREEGRRELFYLSSKAKCS